jgi:succinate dehydrogenase / fumarate reductase iron-sulfur subunit
MAEVPTAEATLQVFRGNREDGKAVDYRVPLVSGMVVLDALHWVQSHHAPDLAVRWNCKAGKCGSCSAEVNGRPRLTCKTRMDALPLDQPITIFPMKAFPVIKDLVTDVSWNFRVNQKIPPFRPRPGVEWKMDQRDVDRVQEFRKCIECFLCQDVCHVLRDHDKKEHFGGPRFFVRTASLEMHPLDGVSRAKVLKEELGIGLCNITKCCTEVCPEDIHITDNAIIPLKERVVDEFYDPLLMLVSKIRSAKKV